MAQIAWIVNRDAISVIIFPAICYSSNFLGIRLETNALTKNPRKVQLEEAPVQSGEISRGASNEKRKRGRIPWSLLEQRLRALNGSEARPNSGGSVFEFCLIRRSLLEQRVRALSGVEARPNNGFERLVAVGTCCPIETFARFQAGCLVSRIFYLHRFS